MLGRVFQHELDHLDGILLLERLEKDQRKEAMRIFRGRGACRDIGRRRERGRRRELGRRPRRLSSPSRGCER